MKFLIAFLREIEREPLEPSQSSYAAWVCDYEWIDFFCEKKKVLFVGEESEGEMKGKSTGNTYTVLRFSFLRAGKCERVETIRLKSLCVCFSGTRNREKGTMREKHKLCFQRKKSAEDKLLNTQTLTFRVSD